MGSPLLLALGTDNPHVHKTVKEVLETYFRAKALTNNVEIAVDSPHYERHEGIEPLLNQALTNATLVRAKYRARIGVAGAWGAVTLRCNKQQTLMFATFFVAAVCEKGLVVTSVGSGTYPPQLTESLKVAMRVVGTPLYPKEHVEPELVEIAQIAAGAWTGLQFPRGNLVEFTLH